MSSPLEPAPSPPSEVAERSLGALVVRGVALVVIYVVVARLGLALAHEQDNATLFWPPTGVALAALLVWGLRFAPAIFVAALAVNLSIGTAMLPTLGIAIGNTLEAVVGAWMLRRLGFEPSFDTRRHVLALVGVALVASAVSALFGVGSLRASGTIGSELVGSVALTWWLGDVGGAIVITPFALLAGRDAEVWRRLARRLDAWLVLGAVLVTSALAFVGPPRTEELLLAFLVVPFLVWAGLSLGPHGAMLAGVVGGLVAVVGTARGGGPFGELDRNLRMMTLWAYVATVGVTASILAAAVAERRRAEQERLAMQRAQHALDVRMRDTQRLEGLGLLASGIAHDFNNILAAIRVNAQLLAPQLRDGNGRQMVGEIDHAVERAADLCRQLLAYGGRAPLPLGPVDPGRVVEDVRRLVASTTPTGTRLVVEVEADVPHVRAERSQLQQVVLNLVLNAFEAIGERGGEVRARVFRRDERVVLEVSDDGPGMNAETRARIFDPFFTTKATGRGLGLAAVAGIVRNHEGTLEVESELGKGTTFRVTLDVTEAPSPTPPVAVVRPSALRLLVADDEAPIRDVLRTALELEGHRVRCVEDGEAAIAAAAEEDFDVVLLDLTLPGLSGVESLAEIRRARPGVGAVLMSGYDESQLPHEEIFLAKPFTLDGLADAVRRASTRGGETEEVEGAGEEVACVAGEGRGTSPRA